MRVCVYVRQVSMEGACVCVYVRHERCVCVCVSSTRVLGSILIRTIGRRAAAKRPGGYNRRVCVLLSYWYLRPRLIPVCFCLIPTSSAEQICVTLEQKVFLGNFAA